MIFKSEIWDKKKCSDSNTFEKGVFIILNADNLSGDVFSYPKYTLDVPPFPIFFIKIKSLSKVANDLTWSSFSFSWKTRKGFEFLNKVFDEPLNRQELHELCASLGSDLNVCLEGGCVLATSRGEVIEKLPYNLELPVTLIKPKKLGISAKEAYTKYALKENKPQNNMTEKMLEALKNGESINDYLYNDLEYAIFDDYSELQNIKSKLPQSIMSGSGSTYFVLENLKDNPFGDDYQIISGIKFIGCGI